MLACASILMGSVSVAMAAPHSFEPTYGSLISDCVAGDNQFWQSGDQKFDWYVNQAGCDSYSNDRYERPTDQTFKNNVISSTVFSTESGLYFEFLDITRAWATYEDVNANNGWMFFRTELFSVAETDSAGKRVDKFGDGSYYTIRLGKNADPNHANGGIALRNQRSTNITNTWSTIDAKGFFDTDNSVSGTGGVNVPKPPDSAGNGYELDEGNNDWLYVRRVSVPFTGPGGSVTRPAVEFAFNYRKYNVNKGRSFTPAAISY